MTYDEYMKETHRNGQIWIWTAVCFVLFVPIAICVYYNAWPSITAVLKGLLGVAPIYWTVGLIEIITFTPMLGTAGTYLSFVTGNVTALKVPAALNAMESVGAKANTEEGEIISTIAIGIFAFAALQPVLSNPVLKPAFDNILPALFGGLGVVYISKNWKVAIVPVIFMIALFIAVPSLASSVGVLVPVGVLISLGAARIMYKKNWL